MPDVTPQPEEPGGLQQLMTSLADKAAGKAEDSKGSSVLTFVVFATLTAICFAILGWIAVSDKRKAAQLEYELRLKEDEQKRIAEQVKLTQNEAIRTAAQNQIQVLTKSVEELKKSVADNEDASVNRAKSLAQAATWTDLQVVDLRGD